ncbi:MAG: universal stress protein [Flavobacteriales bacterium]
MSTERTIKHIFHPTDLSKASEVAFLHALRLAVATHASLTIMHVDNKEESDPWGDMPQVRGTLKKWGLLKDDNDVEEFNALGVRIRKLLVDAGNPLKACKKYLEDHPADLVVLSTHQDSGRSGWMKRKVAEPLMRAVQEVTLLVPHQSPGFVESKTGVVGLRRILLPITSDPDPAQAVRAASFMSRHLGAAQIEFTLLYVGAMADMPSPELPEHDGWTWTRIAREGDVLETILAVEKEIRADLIVMATQGHDGFLDALRGSTTERVLRGASCPMLTGVV